MTPPTSPLRFSVPITLWAHWTALESIARRSMVSKFAWGFFVGLPFAALMLEMLLIPHPLPFVRKHILAFVGGPIAMLVLFPLLRLLSVLSVRKGNAALDHPQIFEFGPNGLSMSGPYQSTHLDWMGLARVIETRREFLFFVSKNTAHFLPKEKLRAEDVERLRSALQEWLPERIFSLPKPPPK